MKVIQVLFIAIILAFMLLKKASTAPESSGAHPVAGSSSAHAATEVLTKIPLPKKNSPNHVKLIYLFWDYLINPMNKEIRKDSDKKFKEKISEESVREHYNVLLHYEEKIIQDWKAVKKSEIEKKDFENNLGQFPSYINESDVIELEVLAFVCIMSTIHKKLEMMKKAMKNMKGEKFDIENDVQNMIETRKVLDFLAIFQNSNPRLNVNKPEDIKKAILQYREGENHKPSV